MKRTLAAIAFLILAACSGGGPPESADDVLAAWLTAGLAPSDFAPLPDAQGLGGECQRGTVDGIDATLCRFADENAARAAQPAGLAHVGESTGAAVSAGRVLLVVADPRNTDPSGKTIHRITQTFQKR